MDSDENGTVLAENAEKATVRHQKNTVGKAAKNPEMTGGLISIIESQNNLIESQNNLIKSLILKTESI